MKISKAEQAGRFLGQAISYMVDLMYQNNTAYNFVKGLKKAVDDEYNERAVARKGRKGSRLDRNSEKQEQKHQE